MTEAARIGAVPVTTPKDAVRLSDGYREGSVLSG